MFIPFTIKKSTIEAVCYGKDYSYDEEAGYISRRLRKNINLETIKQSMINGTRLQEEWFPSEFYDSQFQVFISHAHKDETTVKKLAGYLKKHYGIKSFIDSLYWGYVNDLQRSLDDYYATYTHIGKIHYNYNTRNFLSANVHIMLSMALMKMMDACECLIFVDSDNSLYYSKGVKGTPSPWIYEEVGFSKRLRINIPERYKKKIQVNLNESRERSSYCFFSISDSAPREARFNYEVDMRNVKELMALDFKSNIPLQQNELLDKWYKKYDVKQVVTNQLLR